MAIKTVLIAQALKIIAEEEKRNTLILAITIFISLFIVIIFMPIYLLLHPLETLSMFFGGEDFASVEQLHADYPYILETSTTSSNGRFPVPLEGTITSDYGMRVHPVTGLLSKHTGIDISGKHRDNIIAIYDGVVTIAEIQKGFGNCVEIKHEIVTYETVTDEEGNEKRIKHTEIFYSFYAHLSRIDVVEGMRVMQGNVIGIEGGDPKKDPNAGTSTGHHLHFEIRTKSGYGNDVDPKSYIM